MRDRHFITWLVGLISTPVLLDMFPNYATMLLTTVPIVLGTAAVLAMIGMMILRHDEQNEAEHHETQLVRTGSNSREHLLARQHYFSR